MLRQVSLVQKLTFGFALGPVVLAIIGWVAYSNTVTLQKTAGAVTQSYKILEATASLLARMNEAETGQRGYLLLGDEAYLAPYNDALPAIERNIAALIALGAGNPRYQARLQEVRPLIARRLDAIAETVRIRKEKGFDAAAAKVQDGTGPALMSQIRTMLREIDREETEHLAEYEAARKRVSEATFNVIIYGSAASFILLALVGYFLTRSITVPVRHAVQALASSTAEIVAGTSQQAAGAQEQAAAVAQTMSTVDEIVQTAAQAKERAGAVNEASQRAQEVGNAGRRAVEDTIAVMASVREQSELIAGTILDLAEQAQAIGDIIEAVNEIAEQTNLLALNAAIEASRAGEHGKGFGVVAQEIKSLADQSKKATSQVRHILSAIQRATNNAVMNTEQGGRSVSEAMVKAEQAGGTIRTLTDSIAEAAQLGAQIVASVGQQAIGMSQIQQAMHSISAATNQNLASTRQAERAAQDLEALGRKLRGMLIGTTV